MEFLPKKADYIDVQKAKKMKKVKEFREYLVEKNVVLSLVQFLLKLKQEEQTPDNISEYLEGYYGTYRDPLNDQMDFWRTEIAKFNDAEADLVAQANEMTAEIHSLKRTKILDEDYAKLDPTGAGFSTKAWVNKISGEKKFDSDQKMDKENFHKFIFEYLLVPDEEEPKEEVDEEAKEEETKDIWTDIYEPIRMQLYPDEEGKARPPMFAGRLDDPSYVFFLKKLREFKANS